MFIDVTRYGGLRMLRLSAPAIAYLDGVEGGSAVHLIGGETLRVNEDPAEIERRLAGSSEPSPEEVEPPLASELLAPAFAMTAEEPVAADPSGPAPFRPRGKRR